jgi:putative chitinase
MPSCRDVDVKVHALNDAMTKWGVAKHVDFVAAFLAQLAVESQELNVYVENLNYGAVGLMTTWPKRFPTLDFAKTYERQPQKIANYVYAGRLGNGDVASGDGWRYRGHGWIQCTGRTNIDRALRELNLPPDDPTPLLRPAGAAHSAAAYWARKPQLSALAQDLPGDDDVADFFSITRLINGGTIGVKQRFAYWETLKRVLRKS